MIKISSSLFFLFILYISSNLFAQQDSLLVSENKTDSTSSRIISIMGVGDIMPGTNYPSKSYLPPDNNCNALFSEVQPWLVDNDLTVGNLEGCFSNDAPLVKRCKDSTKCYAFRMPEEYGGSIKNAGFDVLTIANNHSGDFGDLGRETTVSILDSLEIKHAGWLKHPTVTFDKDGVMYGVAAFSPNKGTVSINHITRAQFIVDSLAQISDIVIVTFHGGAEGSKYQHVTKESETFYGENRGNVYEFARLMIDSGADVVFGHGPHVTRAVDLYKDRFIAYSLGNFCTYGRFNLSGPNGIAPLIKVFINEKGEFQNAQIFSAHQLGRGGAFIDESNKAVKIIQSLTEVDFPESPLKIDDKGVIEKKL